MTPYVSPFSVRGREICVAHTDANGFVRAVVVDLAVWIRQPPIRDLRYPAFVHGGDDQGHDLSTRSRVAFSIEHQRSRHTRIAVSTAVRRSPATPGKRDPAFAGPLGSSEGKI